MLLIKSLRSYLRLQACQHQTASVGATASEEPCVRVEQGGWLRTGQQKRVWLVLQVRQVCMGSRGQSLGPGWGSLGGGGEQKLPHDPTGGCSSQRERHQSEVLQQREVRLWRRRKEGWSDNFPRDGCGKEVHLDPFLLVHGSSLSGVEVKECTSLPWKTTICHKGNMNLTDEIMHLLYQLVR